MLQIESMKEKMKREKVQTYDDLDTLDKSEYETNGRYY